jgi:hypothetical protein
MANPTTNYGWPMPTSTDLVTDLPADFAAFGQPVDTTLKALNPETTLGDISYRSATSNTNTRLGIGTSGQVLSVSGGVPAWTTASSGSMTLLSTTSWTTASQTISSISGAYKNLEIWVKDFYSTITDDVNLRLNGTTSSVYQTTGVRGEIGGTFNTYSSASSTVIKLTMPSTTPDNSDNNNFIRFRINDYTNTDTKKIVDFNVTYSSSAFQQNYFGQGSYSASPAAITSVTLWIPTAGSPSGTIYIYGVN